MKKKALLVCLILLLVGCGKEGSDSAASSSCKTQRSSHSGCCSSHGGFGGQCTSGEALYRGNKLICNDGTESPSCTYFVDPLLQITEDYNQEYFDDSYYGFRNLNRTN